MVYHPEKSVILCAIDESCTVHAPVWIGKDVVIGKNVKIQAFAFIPDGVTIEDNAFIGPHVCFTNDPGLTVAGKANWKTTVVKNNARIGANVSIRAGVTIGESAIVGMGSVILQDVPPASTVVGNPGRVIKQLYCTDCGQFPEHCGC